MNHATPKGSACVQFTFAARSRLGEIRAQLSIDDIIEVLHHGADRMLGIVNAEIAVLMRSEEATQECRTIPIGKMLRIGIGVLKGRKELQATLQRFTEAIVVDYVTGLSSDTAGLRQSFRIGSGADLRRSCRRFAILPAHESAHPKRMP